MAPRNGGALEHPDLTGHAGAPGRGAFMILYLKVEDERITAAKDHTVGCGPTIASGSTLTEMIAGRSIAECRTPRTDNSLWCDKRPPRTNAQSGPQFLRDHHIGKARLDVGSNRHT